MSNNILKYELDMPFLFDLLAGAGAATGLDHLADVILSPVFLLGGPICAGLLAILDQVQIVGNDDEEGFTLSRIRFFYHPLSMLVFLTALVGLGVLIGYAAMENLADWIREIVNA